MPKRSLFFLRSLELFGTGLTPDQSLSDFTNFSSGQLTIDIGIIADVTGIQIVPEPGTALLLGLGLSGLAYRRHFADGTRPA